jgi:hypothetical protein
MGPGQIPISVSVATEQALREAPYAAVRELAVALDADGGTGNSSPRSRRQAAARERALEVNAGGGEGSRSRASVVLPRCMVKHGSGGAGAQRHPRPRGPGESHRSRTRVAAPRRISCRRPTGFVAVGHDGLEGEKEIRHFFSFCTGPWVHITRKGRARELIRGVICEQIE